MESSHGQPRWFLYRSKHGDLYFFDSVANKTTYDRPLGYTNVLAVNDPESWHVYLDETSQCLYYYNLQTHEVTWHMPPECQEIPPVNTPQAWIAFRLGTQENADVFYHNKISGETTWERPPEYSEETNPPTTIEDPRIQKARPNVSEKDHGDDAYQDSAGAEFFIPSPSDEDDDENNHDSNGEEDASENVKSDLSNPREDETERALEQSRLELERQERETGFFDLLKEQGVQAHSQWTNWMTKLKNDPRFQKVPIDERSRLFGKYKADKIEAEATDRKNAIKNARKCARDLFDTEEGKRLFRDCTKSKQVLKALRRERNECDSELVSRLLSSLQDLSEKEIKKALRPFLSPNAGDPYS